MIKVILTADKESKTLTLDIEGHAGADEKGKDMVCASATMLMYTFAQCMSDAYRFNQLKKKPIVDFGAGKAHIEAVCKEKFYADNLHTLFVIQTGYLFLEHGYKEYVEVERFDTEKSVSHK